jgi:AI-2 transport protein TqsA
MSASWEKCSHTAGEHIRMNRALTPPRRLEYRPWKLSPSNGENPNRSDELRWLSTVSLLVLAAVAAGAALLYTRAVMVPLVLALFFTYLVAPVVDAMQVRLKIPRWVSIVVAILIVFGLMTVLVMLVTVSSRGLAESAPIYRERFSKLAESLFSVLDRFQIDLGQDDLLQGLRDLPLLSVLRSTAGGVLSFVTSGLLVLFFSIFLLAGRKPHEERRGISKIIDAKIRRYTVTKVATSAATGTLVGTILAVLGVDLAFVFGILAFFLNFIPNVGSIIATLLPLPIAIVQFDSLARVLLVLILPTMVQITIGSILEPKLMGEGLDLHPAAILVALVFWGLIWGPVGMLLAAPITAVLRIVLGRFETTRPVADLLAGRLPGEA